MEWCKCWHCQEFIITSHMNYKPRTKLIPVDNDVPKIAQYCSDACKEGYDLSRTDAQGHSIKHMSIKITKKGRSFLCLKCMEFYPVESLIVEGVKV